MSSTKLIAPTLCALLLLALLQALLAPRAAAQQDACASVALSPPGGNKLYTSCNTLPKLSASLHWAYHPATGTLDVAFRAAQSSSGWVGWGLNPSGSGMVGSEVLLAFPGSDGGLAVYTTKIGSYTPNIRNETLSFPVTARSAQYSGGAMTIYATLLLPANATRMSHVWQAGSVAGGIPVTHPQSGDNLLSKGSIDFLSGESTVASGGSRLRRKNTHGVLNAVSWGVLMPTGAIIARYLKVFKSADPAWFYLHIACQLSAYVVGVAGWGTGLKLGSESVGISYRVHRNIGITLFCLATLQVFALLLRPNKDNKYRIYWNAYHHSVGYTVISLSVVNVFKGLDILDPEKKWKNTYTGVIIALGAVAVVLEAVTWVIVLKRRSSSSSEKPHHGANGNGYGGRPDQGV
ncbi:cytochrome b561 and DOMON domain-containing protein-like [Iris pallida]|uniref:Cytochrome b561 and DOMON domain-containing protein n=1 Tax=Iris pallida TaxID=29817 RepID=A0AAX6H0U4_IRIPA|nr:cytochrome b561 and DOMON domain-containing protein-like [Iris pallida]